MGTNPDPRGVLDHLRAREKSGGHECRSAATRERAEASGMVEVDLAILVGAQVILSVVPPAEARGSRSSFHQS